MSAWAVGVRVSAAMASPRLTAKIFTDPSPISAYALGLNIRRGHADQAYSEKSGQSTGGGDPVRAHLVNDRGFLAFGDRSGEFLLIADALQLVQGLVQAGSYPAAGREGRR